MEGREEKGIEGWRGKKGWGRKNSSETGSEHQDGNQDVWLLATVLALASTSSYFICQKMLNEIVLWQCPLLSSDILIAP